MENVECPNLCSFGMRTLRDFVATRNYSIGASLWSKEGIMLSQRPGQVGKYSWEEGLDMQNRGDM